jgi:hypothetical protein
MVQYCNQCGDELQNFVGEFSWDCHICAETVIIRAVTVNYLFKNINITADLISNLHFLFWLGGRRTS